MELIEREALIKAIESDCPEQVYYTKEDAVACALWLPTIDPIRAAGGCRCGECRYRNTCDHTVRIVPGGPGKGCLHANLHGCEYGEIGEPREAKDDG